jgi:hypothetical protein
MCLLTLLIFKKTARSELAGDPLHARERDSAQCRKSGEQNGKNSGAGTKDPEMVTLDNQGDQVG